MNLDSFTVNLAEEGGDHYLQIGVVYQVEDSKVVDNMKLYMPVVRDRILRLLSAKRPSDIASPEGKCKLIDELIAGARASIPGRCPGQGIAGRPVGVRHPVGAMANEFLSHEEVEALLKGVEEDASEPAFEVGAVRPYRFGSPAENARAEIPALAAINERFAVAMRARLLELVRRSRRSPFPRPAASRSATSCVTSPRRKRPGRCASRRCAGKACWCSSPR